MNKYIEENLYKKINNIRLKKKGIYPVRTHHLSKGEPLYTNRLILEGSPYLLQHAHNPVNWYAFNEEAFETARRLQRPVFLSIGYATCHWCHIMEEESFEDLEIAEYLNENYIAVKVDREERPDLDAVYMTAVQGITGHGGWPMSVWLNEKKEPFYGGTYFPPRDGERGIGAGFLTILEELKNAYDDQPLNISHQTEAIVAFVSKNISTNKSSDFPDSSILSKTLDYYISHYDSSNGGIGGKPKFPSSLNMKFLLRIYDSLKHQGGEDEKYQKVKEMIVNTLKQMAYGGIYDHIEGGFHRYSTDEKWHIPHFEKMLYDNGQLAVDYTEAFLLTKNVFFKTIAYEIFNYLIDEMEADSGGFFSATDADSLNDKNKNEEGWFFSWTIDEIDLILKKEESIFFKTLYNLIPNGNFENRNVLYTTEKSIKEAQSLMPSQHIFYDYKSHINKKILGIRIKRDKPFVDEKILTSWNALIISALAKGAMAFNDKDLLEKACETMNFILESLYDGLSLYRSFNKVRQDTRAFLEDYSYTISAALDLFEATSDTLYLEKAIELDAILIEEFEDDNGGFFTTSKNDRSLFIQPKDFNDGAMPSGNSVQFMNLLKLYHITIDVSYEKRLKKMVKSYGESLSQYPQAYGHLMVGINDYYSDYKEIVIVNGDDNLMHQYKEVLDSIYLPQKIVILVDKSDESINRISPVVNEKVALDNKTTAYICSQGRCSQPVQTIDDFKNQLNKTD